MSKPTHYMLFYWSEEIIETNNVQRSFAFAISAWILFVYCFFFRFLYHILLEQPEQQLTTM